MKTTIWNSIVFLLKDMDKPTVETEKIDVSTSTERGKPFINKWLKYSEAMHANAKILILILEPLESDGIEQNDTHISTSEMGIQADFSDEDSDIDSYSSEGELMIAASEDRQNSTSSKVQNIGSQHSKSLEGEATNTARKAIELKYIYGDDLSKNDIERRKFSMFLKLILLY